MPSAYTKDDLPAGTNTPEPEAVLTVIAVSELFLIKNCFWKVPAPPAAAVGIIKFPDPPALPVRLRRKCLAT